MGSATTGNADSAGTMNTRIIFTAAAMPADQARAIVELICSSSPERAAEQRRNRTQRHFYNALLRILKFAKHETLRKLQRYLYSHRPLTGQDEQPDHPDSVRIGFNVDELQRDLNAMLETEGVSALNNAASDTLEQVGFRDPWKLPAQDTLDFIARRQNLLSNVPQEIFDTIRDQISTGLNKGESIPDLSRRVSTAFDEIGKERAQVIAQTETAAAYGFASDKAARAAGIQYKKWIHSVQSKVPRPDHLAIDGLIIPFDEPYPVGDPPLMYPHAPDGSAEDVINCFLPDTLVSGRFVAGLKTFYSGKIWRIVTANRNTLSVTPNHPILTLRGWIFAKHLAKGDTLLATHSNIHFAAQRNIKNKNREASIEDVFQTFARNGTCAIRRTNSDLYGDGRFTDGNIHIVSSDCHLQEREKTSFLQTRQNLPLILSDSVLTSLPRSSTSNQNLSAVTLPATRSMSFSNQPSPFAAIDVRHSNIHCIGPAADWDSLRFEGSKNRHATDADFARQLLKAHPAEITPDQIIDIETFRYDGHIYDLQTDVGFLIAQNIISSNCRCMSIPVSEADYQAQKK